MRCTHCREKIGHFDKNDDESYLCPICNHSFTPAQVLRMIDNAKNREVNHV